MCDEIHGRQCATISERCAVNTFFEFIVIRFRFSGGSYDCVMDGPHL